MSDSGDENEGQMSPGLAWFVRKVLLLDPNLPPFASPPEAVVAGGDFGDKDDEEEDEKLAALELKKEGDTYNATVTVGGRTAPFQVRCIANPYRAVAIYGTDGKELRHVLAQKIKQMKLNGAQVDLTLGAMDEEQVVLICLRFMQLGDAKKFSNDMDKFLKVPIAGAEAAAPQDGGAPVSHESIDAAAAANFPVRTLGHAAVHNELACLDVSEGGRGVPKTTASWRKSKEPGRMLEVPLQASLPIEFPTRILNEQFESELSRLWEQPLEEADVGHSYLLEVQRVHEGKTYTSRSTSGCVSPATDLSGYCAEMCSTPLVIVEGVVSGEDAAGHLKFATERADLVRLRLHLSRKGVSFQHNDTVGDIFLFDEFYVTRQTRKGKDDIIIHLPDPGEDRRRGDSLPEVWFAFEPTKIHTKLTFTATPIASTTVRDMLYHVICWHKMLREPPNWDDYSVGSATPALHFQECLSQMWTKTTFWEFKYSSAKAFEVQDVDHKPAFDVDARDKSPESSALSDD